MGIAVWNNPQLRADLATIGLAEADLIDAGLLRNPRLEVLMPVGAKPFELLVSLPVELFWQRPRRIAASQQALDQLAQSLIQNGLNTARDAHWALGALCALGGSLFLGLGGTRLLATSC